MRIPGYDVEGWKEVAEVLGVSPGHARRLRKEVDDLPIVTARGKVYATRAGLEAWLRRQVRPLER